MNRSPLFRTIALLLLMLLSFPMLVGCGEEPAEKARISIVTTIFPLYDYAKAVTKDAEGVEVLLLSGAGTDLHSYQPDVSARVAISCCDLFLSLGGESEKWVEKALDNPQNKSRVTLSMFDALADSLKEEAIIEGMETEAEEEGDGVEYDEHLWLSLRNAKITCNAICDAVSRIDPENTSLYAGNCAGYTQKLDALDEKYRTSLAECAGKTLLVCDRFPFRYLCDDYGLSYYAAFAGCSSETDASFETVIFLAKKLDELASPAVLILESGDGKIAEAVLRNSSRGKDTEILRLDSMQSVTKAEADGEGGDYLSRMEANLKVLKAALGGK